MQYAVQVTQRFETTDRAKRDVRATFTHTILPCVSYADARRLHISFDGMESVAIRTPYNDDTEMFRSARVVVGVYDADRTKKVWLSLTDLEQIVSEYREEFNV